MNSLYPTLTCLHKVSSEGVANWQASVHVSETYFITYCLAEVARAAFSDIFFLRGSQFRWHRKLIMKVISLSTTIPAKGRGKGRTTGAVAALRKGSSYLRWEARHSATDRSLAAGHCSFPCLFLLFSKLSNIPRHHGTGDRCRGVCVDGLAFSGIALVFRPSISRRDYGRASGSFVHIWSSWSS